MLAWVVIYRRDLRQSPQFRFIRALPLPASPLNLELLTFNLPLLNVPAFQPSGFQTFQNCLKPFTCNIYRSPRKCCKQKTYGLAKPFRCNTYKKQGGSSFKPKVLLPAPLSRRSEAQTFGRFNGQASRRVSGLPPIFRTLFQVPYPAIPLFATLTKTAGSHPSSQRFFSFLAGLFLFSFHSLYQERFRTPFPPKGSALFLRTAGCHPTIPVLELDLCALHPYSLFRIPNPLSIPRLVVSCG